MEIQHVESHALKGRSNLLDTIQIAFLLTDAHSRILYANRQAESLFGYGRGEIEGERIRVLFLKDDLIYFLPNILYLTLYKDGFEGEVLLRRRDGAKVFVRLLTTAFKEEGETFLTFSLYEIQQLKRLERERLESERWESLGRMVEEIAHQVRNPIVSIGGYTRRVQKIFPSTQKGQSYLDQILHETKRLETMIRRVEEYIRIPKAVYRRESLQEVVEAALQPFSKEASEKGISFTIDTRDLKEDGHPYIDRALVITALSHVLKNSLETITLKPVGKRRMSIRIALFDEGDVVAVAISDKGEGIPKKSLKAVFEPFFSTRPDHVGLGLTLVRRVMGEHGGNVRIESRLKQGTTVTLYFPRDRRRKIRREFISPEVGSVGTRQ
jgi:PAS domain S-box-containing protein